MRKLSLKIKLVASIIFLVIIGIILAFIFNTGFSVLRGNPFSSSKLNVLIAGYDSSINGPPRADTIIVASFDLKTNEAGLLFIPRDTRLKIPGHGVNRINASHAFGGIKLLKKTVESFLKVPIDYYVETDFKGFAEIIDTLGGIKIDIEESLHYVDEAGDLYIDLPAGDTLLNGEKALQYVRYRGTFGDIGRVERQQKFVKALVERMLNPDIIIKLPVLYQEVMEAVNTNIPFQDISPFVHLAKDMKIDQLKTAMVPGQPKYINGASYWIAKDDQLKILVSKLIRSKKYVRNSHYHVSLYNGNGEPGLAGDLAKELEKFGFRISRVANASNFNYEETIIKYYDTRSKTTVLGIQKMIGGKLKYVDKDRHGIRIIIGSDYLQKQR